MSILIFFSGLRDKKEKEEKELKSAELCLLSSHGSLQNEKEQYLQ